MDNSPTQFCLITVVLALIVPSRWWTLNVHLLLFLCLVYLYIFLPLFSSSYVCDILFFLNFISLYDIVCAFIHFFVPLPMCGFPHLNVQPPKNKALFLQPKIYNHTVTIKELPTKKGRFGKFSLYRPRDFGLI